MSRRSKRGVRQVDALVESYAHRHLDPTSIKAATAHFASYCHGLPAGEKARLGASTKELGAFADTWFKKNAPALPGIQARKDPDDGKRQQLAVAQDLARAESIGQVGPQ